MPLRVKSVIQFDKNYWTIEEQILYFLQSQQPNKVVRN
jgi:hypothetical protein